MKNIKGIWLANRDIVLIDGMNLFHRAFNRFVFLRSSNGIMTGGLFGYISSLLGYIKKFDTNKVIICWDGKGKTRRSNINKDYKSNRAGKFTAKEKKEFYSSLVMVKESLNVLGVISVEKSHIEADDIIWFLINKVFERNIIIVSNDKDFFQLVHNVNNVRLYRPNIITGNGELVDNKGVVDFIGVMPGMVKYYLAIAGDMSDNVLGVRGLGKVRTLEILNSGNFDIKKIGSIFSARQVSEFKESYKLVKLGYGLKTFRLNKGNIKINLDHSLLRVKSLLKKYEIKKYSPTELLLLNNSNFKNCFLKKIFN